MNETCFRRHYCVHHFALWGTLFGPVSTQNSEFYPMRIPPALATIPYPQNTTIQRRRTGDPLLGFWHKRNLAHLLFIRL